MTQGLWQAVMGKNPSVCDDEGVDLCEADFPVQQVSWYDAARFANALSAKEGLESCYRFGGNEAPWPAGLACKGYRLPTEAEWEYAARAGKSTLYAGGNDADAVAWTRSNAGGKPHRVGTKAANDGGLQDMSGNVREWTWDVKGDYPSGSGTDPRLSLEAHWWTLGEDRSRPLVCTPGLPGHCRVEAVALRGRPG